MPTQKGFCIFFDAYRVMKRLFIRIKSYLSVKPSKHSLFKYVLSYILIVFFSAVINWGLFSCNSTSFSISSQMNKYMDRYDLLDSTVNLATFHQGAKDKMPVAIDDYITLIRPDFIRLDSINELLNIDQKLLESIQLRSRMLNIVADEKRQAAIMAFTDSMLCENQQRIDSLRRYMLGKDSTELIIQGKYVELAHLKYEYAKKNAEILEYIIRHFGSFIPDSLSKELTHLNQNEIQMGNKIQDLENSRRAVSSKIKKSVNSFHQNRRESVSFLDFLYYSICVSTTVSFGDIVPNDGWTRFAAILELLSCLILVGVIIDKINKKINRNCPGG